MSTCTHLLLGASVTACSYCFVYRCRNSNSVQLFCDFAKTMSYYYLLTARIMHLFLWVNCVQFCFCHFANYLHLLCAFAALTMLCTYSAFADLTLVVANRTYGSSIIFFKFCNIDVEVISTFALLSTSC